MKNNFKTKVLRRR